MFREIQKFEVSIKGFVIKGSQLLILEEVGNGLWELPGGRIDVGEELELHAAILSREINEELGENFNVEIGPPIVSWVRGKRESCVFLVGRLCRYVRGEIKLSPEHASYAWVTNKSWKRYNFASGYNFALEEFWNGFSQLSK